MFQPHLDHWVEQSWIIAVGSKKSVRVNPERLQMSVDRLSAVSRTRPFNFDLGSKDRIFGFQEPDLLGELSA